MSLATRATRAADRAATLRRRARPAARRSVRALEEPVLAAFGALVARQARVGAPTPAVERTLAAALRHVAMTDGGRPRLSSPVVTEVRDQFHRLWYDDAGTWRENRWQGTTTWKCPLDLWLYQELLHRIRPGLVVETGTAYGGSAAYLACLLDLAGHGRIVSVDLHPKSGRPTHPRVTYLAGSSTDPAIVSQVRAAVPAGEPVLVILDSDHSERHVLDELHTYADLVTPGSYVVVEDTNVNGHPAYPGHGPGPMEAVRRFLGERDDFRVDVAMHRLHLSLNPEGFLQRVR